MADLRPPAERGEETGRGQVILVAAFALAVTFIALALVVNSAIYTENLATRSKAQAGGDALEYRHSVEQALGEVVRFANRNNNSQYDHVKDNVTVALGNASHALAIQSIEQGTAISLQKASPWHRRGSIVIQNNQSRFRSSDAGGSQADDWTLATDVDRVRAFSINVTDRSVLASSQGSAYSATVDNAAPGPSETWELFVWDDSGDLVVRVERSDTGTSGTCRVSEAGPVVIDVTAATVADEYCPALDVVNGNEMHFGAGVDRPYNVSFQNGDVIRGNYSLVLTNTSIGEFTGSFPNFGRPGSASQPHAFPAMYSLSVQLDYQTPTVSYETVVRIARGEPDD